MVQDAKVNLLVVDDDEIDRESILRSLSKSHVGNQTSTAKDGVEALQMLRSNEAESQLERPLVVLLDWKMPRMNGHEFLTELRADPSIRDTTVFVVTTSDDQTDMNAAYNKNVAGYIVKDRAGLQFENLIDLLDSYSKLVQLPA